MSQKTYRRTRNMVIRKDGRKFEAVLATETPVQRGDYSEILKITPQSVDLSRFPVPLLRSHDMDQLPVGVVTNPRFKGRELIGDVILSDTPDGDRLYKDMKDGILRNVSIGYSVSKTEPGKNDEMIVTRFQIHEVSVVAVNADPKAQITSERKKVMTDTVNREEIAEIVAIGKRHNQVEMAQQAIERCESLTQFRSRLLDKVADQPLPFREIDDLGLSDRETRSFSLAKAIQAKAENDWSNAGFEAEVLRETSKRSKHGGLVIPSSLLKRDLVTSSPSNGSNLIQTDVLGGSFIDALVQASVVLEQTTLLTGNTGDIAVPKMSTSQTAYWVSETGAITESAPVVGQVQMSPKSIAGFSEYSRRMLQQSSTDLESLLRRDLANQIASAIDAAIIEGGGSNEPTGVLQTNGIGSVALGTNGGAITYAALVNLVKEIATDNALNGNLAFLTNPKVVASMRQTPRQTSGVEGNFILGEENSLLGYPVLSSNNVPSDLSKGSGSNLSAVCFGNWADVLVAFWSDLEILVDPYTKSNQNLISIRAVSDIDVGVRHAESFAAIKDVVAS